MKTVIDREGTDITAMIETAASNAGVDPIHLLALLMAESGLNRYAERYGRNTAEFKQRLLWLEAGDISQEVELQRLINDTWPDVSFSYGQQIVLFHYAGDRSASLDNVLAVRSDVFANPAVNIQDAANRFAGGIARSLDGSALGGMVVYNAGSDRRNDSVWMAIWGANVAAYERALVDAEEYREASQPTLIDHLDQLWGVAQELRAARHEDLAGRIEERVIAIKNL